MAYKRIIIGTAGASDTDGDKTSTTTFAEWDGIEGVMANTMFKLDAAAASGDVTLNVRRINPSDTAAGEVSYTVYTAAMTGASSNVFWPDNELWLLSTDEVDVVNGTDQALNYSITITE